MLHLQLHC